ncbi:MAG: response regulator transcription factor [Deltaproteobacteria bacterium]|nr:response regulator transcription factor [Deltaproteobacteria bacterium]
MAIRIFLADDHTIFRHGLRAVLEKHSDFEVVGESSNGPETLQRLKGVKSDVLVLDLSMPGGLSGARVAEEALKEHPRLAIVVLTMHEDEYCLKEMFEIGASSFVLKRSSPESLAEAIRSAFRREHYVDPALSDHMVTAFIGRQAGETPRRMDQLTTREREVCRLLALGHTNAEVGRKLHISQRTVETHRTNIMKRLGLKNRAELVRFAIDNQLLKVV